MVLCYYISYTAFVETGTAQFATIVKRRKGNADDLFSPGTASPARRPGRPPG